ncbi:MAG: diguanylate cyclase domain-containing protein, partial [Halochromatium sp.]
MTIFGGLIQNASLLLALALAHGLFITGLPRGRLATQLLTGLLFGLTAVLGMTYPVTIGPGLFFDGRTIIIGMAGLFGGVPGALVSGLIAAIYRGWLGGAGMVMGIATIVTAMVFGALFHGLRRAGKLRPTALTLAAFGLLLHLAAFAWVGLLPAAERAQVLGQVALPFLLVFPLVSMLLGLLLRQQEQRIDDERSLHEKHDRIQELHERIQKIAAHVPGMIYQYRLWPDGRSCFPYVSENAQAIYGIEPSRIMEDASPAFAALHADDRERVKAAIERSARTLTTWRESYRVRLADDRLIWVEGEASPQRQPDGSVLWHGYIHDVTERHHAETQLRLAASVFAHSLEGIAITDAENRLVDVNPSFTRITGYGKQELLGEDPKKLASGRHERAFYQRMWAAIEADGSWQGEIWNRRKNGEIYPEHLSITVVRDAGGAVQHHIGVFTDISALKAHEAELDRIAHYDHLTGLPNRRLLMDRLEQAIAHAKRSGIVLAVCYLDLDGFKPINDRHGHGVGDRVLVKVTESLRRVVRGEDSVARLGGDEFVLLLTELRQPNDCFALLRRVLAGIREPIRVGNTVHHLSASIGVTLCPPDLA